MPLILLLDSEDVVKLAVMFLCGAALGWHEPAFADCRFKVGLAPICINNTGENAADLLNLYGLSKERLDADSARDYVQRFNCHIVGDKARVPHLIRSPGSKMIATYSGYVSVTFVIIPGIFGWVATDYLEGECDRPLPPEVGKGVPLGH
jgi:hypothetical protein